MIEDLKKENFFLKEKITKIKEVFDIEGPKSLKFENIENHFT